MKKKILSLLTVAVLVSVTALTGCKPKEAAPTQADTAKVGNIAAQASGGTLRYAIWSSPKGLFNPNLNEDIYDDRVNTLVYQCLIDYDKNYNYKPSLADKYEISKDNLTITFYLNKNAKWHDGKPVTAEDVAFTFTTICDPGYTGPRFGSIDKIAGATDYKEKKATSVSGIKVIDANTISFTFSEIFAPALYTFASRGIIPKHIWEKIPVADWSKSTDVLRNAIGCGPFKMTKYVPDQYVELEKYKDFNLGEPKLDKIILKVSNQETAQSELLKGDLDVVMLSSMKQKDIDAYKNGGAAVIEYASTGYQYMGVNMRNPIFADKRVRQALMYGINRKAMVDNLLEGHGSVVNNPIVENNWAFPGKDKINQYPYDVNKAKALLKEAGWLDNGGTLYKDGKPFEVTLKYPTGNKVREQSAPIIQQNLKDLGIKVNLETMEFATLQQVTGEHNFDMFLMGWSLGPEPDQKTMWHSSVAVKGGWNRDGFINETNDKLLDDGRKSLDQNERKKIYSEWVKLMNEEVPCIFLYGQTEGRAYNKKLKNYEPFTFVEWPNVKDWYIEK